MSQFRAKLSEAAGDIHYNYENKQKNQMKIMKSMSNSKYASPTKLKEQ